MAVDPGWTLLTLKDYFDMRIVASEKAITLAAANVDRRLNGMNELREQLSQERGRYMSVESYEERSSAFAARLESGDDKNSVRIGALERWQWKIVGALILVSVVLPGVVGLVVFFATRHVAP